MTLPAGVAERFPPALRERLVALRRSLHRHPELSGAERRTQRELRTALEAAAPAELREVAGTGLVARIAGSEPDVPPVAVRGDIDALPITEATGLPYASEETGVMHACGHDVHATWAVAAAHLLSARPAAGDVLVVLQPAEERALGARAVLESGALDGAAVIFGGHVDREYPVGAVVVHEGPIAASADFFAVRLRGAGGHGARPHQTRDPIAAAAALVTVLYATVPRRLDPDRPAVLTVGSLHAGEAANVIPDRAELRGTIRATLPEVREMVIGELRRLAEAVAGAHGVDAEVVVEPAVPPLLNAPRPAAWARAAALDVLGPEGVVPLAAANLAGEDFAIYLERMAGCFLRIGAREPGGEFVPAHSPRFYAAEEALFVGAAVLAEAARRASAALAEDAGAGGRAAG